MLCDYGCGQEVKFSMSSGKGCCSKLPCMCPTIKKKNSDKNIGKSRNKGKNKPPMSLEHRRKISISKMGKKRKPFSEEWKKKIGDSIRGKIKGLKRGPITEETKEK